MQIKVKNIVLSIAFFAGLLALLMFASLFFQPKDNTEEYGMEDVTANAILAEPEESLDVVVIGDSISYCAVMPLQIWREHGITSYVCGTPWQKLYYSKEFLEKTFEKQSPEIVVLETASMFTPYDKKDVIKNRIECVMPVFRYHDRWKDFDQMLESDMTLDVNYTYQYTSKGYRYYSEGTNYNPGEYAYRTQEVEPIAELNKDMILEIAKFCKKRDAKLVFLSVPNANIWSPMRHNAISLLAEELDIEYIDMNYLQDEVPIVWNTDCFDKGEHMNYFGAKKVTAYLGQYLADKDIFEDKRENAQFEKWNEEEEAFFSYLGE